MKKLLLLVVGLSAFGISANAATSHYEAYKNKKSHEETVQVQKQVNERVTAVQSQVHSLQTKYETLLSECQKGQGAYDSLPSTIKARIQAPSCPVLQ